MRHIGNVVYRQRYQGFESLRLRQEIKILNRLFFGGFDFALAGAEGMRQSVQAHFMCRTKMKFSCVWRAWRIREYTITKIIKMEFLSPRIFIDFCYCVSRGGNKNFIQEIKILNRPKWAVFLFLLFYSGQFVINFRFWQIAQGQIPTEHMFIFVGNSFTHICICLGR